MSIDVESICSIFYQHFCQKRWKSFVRPIIYNIISVGVKWKPSYIWDFGPCPKIDNVTDFIKSLRKFNAIFNDIRVIRIENEIILVNCINLMEVFRNNASIYCDISSHLDHIRVVDDDVLCQINDMKQKVSNYLGTGVDTGEENLIVIPTEEDWCIPTLYGMLLNYPVIYWFRNDNHDTKLNFSNVYSYNITFDVMCGHSSKQVVLYSFSIPALFDRGNVNKWFNNIKDRFEHSSVENFTNIQLHCKLVALKMVTL